jgi:hypothetical protein
MASENAIPGMEIPEGYTEAASGGSAPWQELPPPKLFTNAFVFDATGRAVLLGYKKRGFGKDMCVSFLVNETFCSLTRDTGGMVLVERLSRARQRYKLRDASCRSAS